MSYSRGMQSKILRSSYNNAQFAQCDKDIFAHEEINIKRFELVVFEHENRMLNGENFDS